MFTIRPEQLEAFARACLDGFAERTAAHLQQTYPLEVAAQGLGRAELQDLARAGEARSRDYAVVDEADVVRFVECALLLGRAFDRDEAWAAATLARADLSGEAKMDTLDEFRLFGRGEPV